MAKTEAGKKKTSAAAAAKIKKEPARKAAPRVKQSSRSQERVVDSESESESEEEETQRSTATTTTAAAETEEDSETSGSDESGSDETASESESGSEEEEEEDEEELASSAKLPKGSYKYAPPPEFKLVPPGGGSNPFSAANLNGKELWFITAPLAAPLSKVDRISPADIAEGLPVLMTGSGRSYCLRTKEEEEGGGEVGLFVADGRGGYKLAGKKISKSFQMVEALPTGREVTEEMIKSKPVKQQPEGLRMRFKPIGFEGEMESDGNVEMRDVSLEVRPAREVARGDGEHKKKKRRTHDDKEERKEKKHRRRSKE
ncbi:uncharacterized protein H6S33_012929 [Morchella sextelata]|uniref:uncharacterized protein n=1 Tax=Morchella sextelata TaxID=1174677 RepID=UPI001D053155|nr:uncharacterized protein H6S33_012929 [Morchella sextelata]KAH0609443.1 hypothetical protein H6S33_012929 [Morchella sextelata]